MKNIHLVLFFIACTVIAHAQDSGKSYYDEGWAPTSRDSAVYYRNWVRSADKYEIHDYYKNGRPLLTGYLSTLTENFWAERNGHFVYFDKATGTTVAEGDYKNGRKNGPWKYYNTYTRVLNTEVSYTADLITRERGFDHDGKTVSYVNYYQLGKMVSQTDYYENGTKKKETEYNGKDIAFEKCYSIAGADTSCKTEEKKQLVEQMPSPDFNMGDYLSENIHYPELARKRGITGRVPVEFVVLEDGSISNVLVRTSIYPALDEEAIRVIAAMPKWKPGMQNGKPVKVLFTQPITFKIE